MLYYIIEKMEITESGDYIKYTPVGYVTNKDDMYKCLDVELIGVLRKWLDDNRDGLTSGDIKPTKFVEQYGIDHAYISSIITTNIEGHDIPEIIDFDKLGGL